MLKKIIVLYIIFSVSFPFLKCQDLPLGFIEHYKNFFVQTQLDTVIKYSSNTRIKPATEGKRKYLEMESTGVDSNFLPNSQMILSDQIYGEFVMELELFYRDNDQNIGNSLYLLTGIRDSSNYYSICIGSDSTRFYRRYHNHTDTLKTMGHLNLEPGKWNKIKITRDILNRNFKIESNEKTVFIHDAGLVMGYIGFGTNSWLGIDSIIIWAPTSIKKPAPLFLKN